MQIYRIGIFFIQFPKYSWFKIYNAYKSRILKSNYEWVIIYISIQKGYF